jgi:hypothetical protein
MYACAVEILLEHIPPTMRETKSMNTVPANPKIRYETALPARLMSITGFLPILSDILPKIGVKIVCITEKITMSIPISFTLACREFSAYTGSTGTMIPNPSISINTVEKTITCGERFMEYF